MPVGDSLHIAWKSRFGDEPPTSANLVEIFLNHRSVRHFADREVPSETVEALVGAGLSASTSSSLQLWSVVSVEDRVLRKEVAQSCADQEHVLNAPWFFAFLADHHRMRSIARRLGYGGEGLDYVEFFTMAVVDVALAAERMACAAEANGLGICYIGALRNDPQRIKELLGLPEGVFGVFGMTLGWPAEAEQEQIKPRLRPDDVWFRDRYRADPDLSGYDERMAEHFAGRGMKTSSTWSMRSARRTDNDHLTGREVLKPWLEEQGFNRR